MILPPGDTHFIPYVEQGYYQRDTYQAAMKYVKERRVAVDVGAHVGFWSIEMAADFETVYAFEPVEENWRCLTRNVPSNVISLNIALGDHAGLIGLTNPALDNSGAWETRDGGGDALLSRLDSITLRDVGLIKIDVQGDELKVLKGAQKTIANGHPVVVVETIMNDRHHPEAGMFLSSLGYRMAERVNKDEVWVPG